jgi:hypothetical protein
MEGGKYFEGFEKMVLMKISGPNEEDIKSGRDGIMKSLLI